MTSRESLCILTAAYNDWASLKALLPLLDRTLAGAAAGARVVVMDDGSLDPAPDDLLDGHDFAFIREVTVLTLVRNLGNQRALSIGVGYVAAEIDCDYLVVMDADHEDRPEVVPTLLTAARREEGRKIVFASRTERSEGPVFKALYGLYKKLYGMLTGMPISIGNFSVVPRRLIRRLAGVWEIGLHFPAGVMKARLPFTSLGAARGRRLHGTTNMNLVNLVVHGFSGLAVHAEVVGVRVVLGSLALAVAVFALDLVLFYGRLFSDVTIAMGWTSQITLTFAVLLLQVFMPGLLMMFMGLHQRIQRQIIPLVDYKTFILETLTLTPSGH
ncbi:MAG: glycosyltransferase [Phaeospirillum sp.]|nr:glycosyltransferase [Phaeospirillum sp.]